MSAITNLRTVYELLFDKESKDVFRLRMEYLLTGSYRPIEEITKKYIPELTTTPFYEVDDVLQMAGERNIVVYGAGGDSDFYSHYWKEMGKKSSLVFCDRNDELQRNGFLGYDVVDPKELYLNYSKAFVIIASTLYRSEIEQGLLSNGIKKEQICPPIFPALKVSKDQYFEPEIIRFMDDQQEVYVDGGSLDLSSVKELAGKCNLKKAYAFEPSPDHYKECLQIKEGISADVQLIQCGLWSKRGKLQFETRKDGGSHINDNGDASINVCSLDEVVDGNEKITFIKMDIEGAELEALKGAKKTIQRDKPRLAICIYHKPEDMYEIPMYIKELVPEYKLYIRAYSNRQFETVLYAVL